MFPLKIPAEIKHDAGEEVNDERETYRQKRSVYKKQAELGDGDVKALANIGAHTK